MDTELNKQRGFEMLPLLSECHIRVLKVIPASDATSIHCNLCQYNLEIFPEIVYYALSYRWGTAERAEDVRTIHIDGADFVVRKTVWEFLQVMQAEREYNSFFIDAICIDQTNLQEEGHQIRCMDKIYKHATKVFIWLGMPELEVQEELSAFGTKLDAFVEAQEQWKPNDFVIHDSIYRHLHDSIYGYWNYVLGGIWTEEACKGFEFICSRPFWKRLWIVQEVVLAESIVIYCGELSWKWEDIAKLKDWAGKDMYGFDKEVLEQLNRLDSHPSNRHPSKRLQRREQSHFADWGYAAKIFDAKEQWMTLSNSDGISLYRAISLFDDQDCGEPRDKLYALLGLLDEISIEPDYGLDILDVYKLALRQGLDQLCWDIKQLPIRSLREFPTIAHPYFSRYCSKLLEVFQFSKSQLAKAEEIAQKQLTEALREVRSEEDKDEEGISSRWIYG